MPIEQKNNHNNFKRFKILKASDLKLIIITMIFMSISIIATIQINVQIHNRYIHGALSKATDDFIANVFNEHSEVYQTLYSLPLPPVCDPNRFETIIFRYKHIKNIGVIKNDSIVCDVYSGTNQQTTIGEYSTFTDSAGNIFKFWSRNEYAFVATPDGYFVGYDKNYYMNFDLNEDVSGFLLFGRQSGKIWFEELQHNITNEELKKAKSIFKEMLKEYKSNHFTKSITKHVGNYIFKVKVVDDGNIAGVFINTKYSTHYKHTGVINIICGISLGILATLLWLHFNKIRNSLHNRLSKAIDHRQLHMVYQPFVDLKNDQQPIVGFESLVRWQLPNGELIPPDIFVPVAERYKLTLKLTLFIIDKVFEDLHDIFKENPHLYTSINISPTDLLDNQLIDAILKNIKKYQLSISNIVIELTERTTADEKMNECINKIREEGFKISIDDFGTGQSNVKYLADFKPDIIKVDRSFVVWSDSDGPTSTLLKKLISLGKSFKIKVVVEGVETINQANRCIEFNADIGQGYFWHKPIMPKEIPPLLKH